MLSKPASSAAIAIVRAGVRAVRARRRARRTRGSGARIANPRVRPPARPRAERSARRARARGGRPSARGRHRTRRSSASRWAFTCRACWASTRSGTILLRARLRARHSVVGVSNTTHAVASPCARACAIHPDRRSASRPSVSTTVVSPRPTRRRTMSSSNVNASALAARSSSLSPTTARSVVARHDLLGCEVRERPRRLARARRADQDDQARRRQHDVVVDHARAPRFAARAAPVSRGRSGEDCDDVGPSASADWTGAGPSSYIADVRSRPNAGSAGKGLVRDRAHAARTGRDRRCRRPRVADG